ncbi:Protein TEX261 [Entamoeba marina]
MFSITDILTFLLQYAPSIMATVILLCLGIASGMYVFSLFVEERPSHARTIVQLFIIGSFCQTLLCFRIIPWYIVILLLVNVYTLWTVPLLVLASVVVSPESLIGSGNENEKRHRSLFARFINKVFKKTTDYAESFK